jgi:GNAT superfamily N-acetyltransferase
MTSASHALDSRVVRLAKMEIVGRSERASQAPVVVRLCRPAEIELLGPIDVSANPVFAQWGHPEFESDSYDSIPPDIAFAAIEDGRLLACDLEVSGGESQLIGWLIMFDRPDGETSIGQISIHADHMGNGYGVPLLRAAIERCQRVGRTSIVLNTQTDVPWNRRWYERFGFSVVAVEQWNADMHDTVAEQTSAGLDWATRVHMRLALQAKRNP